MDDLSLLCRRWQGRRDSGYSSCAFDVRSICFTKKVAAIIDSFGDGFHFAAVFSAAVSPGTFGVVVAVPKLTLRNSSPLMLPYRSVFHELTVHTPA